MSRSRRTPPPQTWATLVAQATSAYEGQANVVEDVPVSAEQTSFRGAGHRVTLEVHPEKAIFGDLPKDDVRLEGDTRRPPERRLALDEEMFPPDSLRELPFWDFARSGKPQRVLVLTGKDDTVRALAARDDLPAAIAAIHGWLGRDPGKRDILKDLAKGSASPVAWVAGFQIAADDAADLADLAGEFLSARGIPAAAAAGVVDDLNARALRLPGGKRAELADALLKHWTTEKEPEPIREYVRWFGGNWQNLDENGRPAVDDIQQQIDRAKSLSFSSSQGDAWREQIGMDASALEQTIGGSSGDDE